MSLAALAIAICVFVIAGGAAVAANGGSWVVPFVVAFACLTWVLSGLGHILRTRRGPQLIESMGAVEAGPGLPQMTRAALLQAAIATGHEEEPRLYLSPQDSINAAVIGRPDSDEWSVVATKGLLKLTSAEQTSVFANILARRSNRLISWPLINMILVLTAIQLAAFGVFMPVLTQALGEPSVTSRVPSLWLPSVLLFFAAWEVYGYAERKILVLSDEDALFRTKDPENVLSALVKAGVVGSTIAGCERYWHYLFWRMPQGFDDRIFGQRILAIEAVGGAATAGVRQKVLRAGGLKPASVAKPHFAELSIKGPGARFVGPAVLVLAASAVVGPAVLLIRSGEAMRMYDTFGLFGCIYFAAMILVLSAALGFIGWRLTFKKS